MPRGKSNQNAGILEYALRHLEQELAEVLVRIDHVRGQLGVWVGGFTATPAATVTAGAAPRKKRVMSAAARRRIAAAQRKRWAAHRKATAGKGAKAAK